MLVNAEAAAWANVERPQRASAKTNDVEAVFDALDANQPGLRLVRLDKRPALRPISKSPPP